jgi:hypothetical protein
MKNKKDLLICDCHSTDHQLIIWYEENELDDGQTYPMCYFHIHLTKRPFWQRVAYGLRYIFGRQCRYGAFDEFIFNPDDSDKLQNLVDYLKREHKGGE